MRVGILGPLEVRSGGGVVAVEGARLRALLIRLAVDPGRVVPAAALIDALWPQEPPARPLHAVQALASRLRKVLPAPAAVESAQGGYRLAVSAEAVDAVRFERLAGSGRQALRTGDARAAAERLGAALALWRGPALADVVQAPYAVATAARWEELRLACAEDLAEAGLAGAAEPADLIAELRRQAAAHPLRERTRELLVRALAADGRTAEALTAYEDYRALLADELGSDPGPQLRAAHLAVLRAGEEPPGPPGRGNLRAALTTFVGRERELAQVGERLARDRLVTLVGPGGVGKTRLATCVADRRAARFPGGVWLAELAPVAHAADVPGAVAAALGLRETAGREAAGREESGPYDPVRRLADALGARRALLVLDNCEHLLDAAAALAEELLGRCRQLRLLVTSRQPLGLVGEALYEVGALDEAAAVRLFTDRAAAVRAGFAPDAEGGDDGTGTDAGTDTRRAVAEICRRLDRLPLAIELAAGRLRTMPLATLAERLEDRFGVLIGGSRTALPRHRTLRAVVEWSWELLGADERAAAERLAVFPASFDDVAAARLGADRETLAALVDKSLLQLLDADGPRYRMLETIRAYALGRLAAGGREPEARAAHAAYYRGLAERAEPHLRGAGQLPWLRTLATERANLHAALAYAGGSGDTATAVRLGAALGLFWAVRGEHAEAAHALRPVLADTGPAPAPERAAAAAAFLLGAVLSGSTDTTLQLRPRLEEIAREAAGLPAGAFTTALLALTAGDTDRGLAAVSGRLADPDPWTRGMMWLARSFLQGNHGGMTAMRHNLAAATTAFRAAGERWGLVTAQTQLALALTTMGDYPAAVAALEEATAAARELGTDGAHRLWLAMVRIHTGDTAGARAELLGTAASLRSARDVAHAHVLLADLARYDGDLERAREHLARAEQALVEDSGLFTGLVRSGKGFLAVAAGDLDAARGHLAAALTTAVALPDLPMAAALAVGVAHLRLREGAPEEAAEVLGASEALLGAPNAAHPDVAQVARALDAALEPVRRQAAYERGRGRAGQDALAFVDDRLAPRPSPAAADQTRLR